MNRSRRFQSHPARIAKARGAAATGFAALVLLAGAGCAQDSLQTSTPPPTSTATIRPAAAQAPTFVLTVRPEVDIQRDLEEARSAQQNAEMSALQAAQTVTKSKGELEIKKKELETLKARLDSAKKQKLEGERVSLDRQRQGDELDIKLLERRLAVDATRVELARAEKELAAARGSEYDHELQLGKKQAEWQDLTAPGNVAASAQRIVGLESEIRDFERRTLESMSERTAKMEELAKRQRSVIEAQLGTLEAQNAIKEFVSRAR